MINSKLDTIKYLIGVPLGTPKLGVPKLSI